MNTEKGFTLIELLVIIALLVVLAAVIVPNLDNIFNSDNITENVTVMEFLEPIIAYEPDIYDRIANIVEALTENNTLLYDITVSFEIDEMIRGGHEKINISIFLYKGDYVELD